MKQIMIVSALCLMTVAAVAQNRVIHGQLTAYNEFPVMNVEVTSKKAKATTVTDTLGNFSLVCEEKDVVMIKPKVFRPVNKKVDADTDSLKINLVFIDTKKNRELAVNNGYVHETDLNYAVANLEAENNDYCKYTDIFKLIEAEFGGVTVENGQVLIRGGKTSFSAGSSYALIIVDGQPTQSIEWIRPCFVRSVRILKGPEAAIYGSRGGNGVVVITTK
jgi:TonB-dependent SusC/RagA subfamily outer membrane receptor